MSELVKWIDNGEYDIVGDIHGEIDAITNLIYHLGYDKDGNQILSELHDSKRDPEAPFDPMAQVDILITEVDPVITARVLELVKKMVGEKLDAFAKTREYDSIVSLATYATSAIPKFKEEGQRGVDVRDATFVAMYGYLEEMMQGTAFVPKSMYEVESKLPALTWEDAPAP